MLIPIQVNGIANQINGTFGLASVCLDISHEFVEDLQLRLQSPDGRSSTFLLVMAGTDRDTGTPVS